jgi:hypothetical protein
VSDSQRAAAVFTVAFGLPPVVIIIVGSILGHRVAAIFVAVGLIMLTQVVATVLSVRRSKARARLKRP